jgi:oligopeptide transport system substrate-binding protein
LQILAISGDDPQADESMLSFFNTNTQSGGLGPGCVRLFVFSLLTLLFTACSQLEKPAPPPFYAETQPPPRQEFRWSNGKLPKSLDPGRAAAPPETDLVRALFEGLTELDPATMQELPGVAEKWTSTGDFRNWTFYLRDNAKWSNGKPVTAFDFVRSWERLASLGDKSAHEELASNIMGFPQVGQRKRPNAAETPDLLSSIERSTPERSASESSNTLIPPLVPNRNSNSNGNNASRVERQGPAPITFGVVAADARTLNVSLVLPDKDFPKLVSNPIFRPVFEGSAFNGEKLDGNLVTNGAFRIAGINTDGITLERSETYWNRGVVTLERVRFVSLENAEKALQAYRAGELDAVTNADFAPLALKLLQPYEDFRRTTHSALNYYEVNTQNPPFDDRRVREALAIAIERERLTEGELDGSTQPAFQFMPYSKTAASLVQDKERARSLMEEAGFPNGENFPAIRLVVNRNDTQQRIARSVARMWKQSLNLDTEIIVKEAGELAGIKSSGEFDLLRKNVVLPTVDETASFLSIFASEGVPAVNVPAKNQERKLLQGTQSQTESSGRPEPALAEDVAKEMILSEEDALYEFHAIPLYFPTSYSLVKPYVTGFETNGLDAPLLNRVSIDNEWQPRTAARESK